MDLESSFLAAIGNDPGRRRDALHELVGRGADIAPDVIAMWRKYAPIDADCLAPVIIRWPIQLAVLLLAPLLEDDLPGVAVGAATVLGRTRDAAAVPPLAAALSRSVRHAAAAALGQNGSMEGLRPLQQLLERIVGNAIDFAVVDERDPSDVKLIALIIQSLGRLGDDSCAPWLVEILMKAEEISAREAAAVALREMPVAEALVALTAALTGPTSYLQSTALRALWSYRMIDTVDAIMKTPLSDQLRTDGAALLYDVAMLEVTEEDYEEWAQRWAHRRAELPARLCLLAGEPISVRALVERIHGSVRVEQAVREIQLFYGFHPRWDRYFDEPSARIEELDRWADEMAPSFTPGLMYRFGREVPPHRLPRSAY